MDEIGGVEVVRKIGGGLERDTKKRKKGSKQNKGGRGGGKGRQATSAGVALPF